MAGQSIIASKSKSLQRCYGPEFIAPRVRDWITTVGAKAAYIEPVSPRENGCCESFSARFRDELLNGKSFYNLQKAGVEGSNLLTLTKSHQQSWTFAAGLAYAGRYSPGTSRSAAALMSAGGVPGASLLP